MAESSLLKQYKREAGVIISELESSYMTAPITSCEKAALKILSRRRTKAIRAAVLAGLVVGALCSRGGEGEKAAETLIHCLATLGGE